MVSNKSVITTLVWEIFQRRNPEQASVNDEQAKTKEKQAQTERLES